MIYDKLINEMKFGKTTLEEDIRSGKIKIIFESENDILDEFKIEGKEGDSFNIIVRNKYLNGSSGSNIDHDPTIKIEIQGKKIPITIEHDPQLHKASNNEKNRKILKDHMPSIKQFIFNDRKNLIKYWHVDPNTLEGKRKVESLQRKITNKYYKENK